MQHSTCPARIYPAPNSANDAVPEGETSATVPALRIAHVMGYYMPGLGYQENYLPFEQARLGHEVFILASDRYAPHERYDRVYAPRLGPRRVGPGTSRERNVAICRVPTLFEVERRQNPMLAGIAGAVRALDADIVHLHGVSPISTLQVVLSAMPTRAILVCDHHLCRFNLEPMTPTKALYYAAFRALVRPIMERRVKAWLPINEDAEMVLRNTLGISRGLIEVSRLGVDTNSFRRHPEAGEEWRRDTGIDANTVLVVHAGRLEPRKRVEDLVWAFARAFRGDRARLLLAGDGPIDYMSSLSRMVQCLGVEAQVDFIGMQPHDRLPALFNAADLGVWPGDAAITMTEALGCGLPLAIASEPGIHFVGGCPEVVDFRLGDREALAKVLSALGTRNEARRTRIADFVARNLGWPAIARQSIKIYRRALAA